jgi:hypothetical protein
MFIGDSADLGSAVLGGFDDMLAIATARTTCNLLIGESGSLISRNP